MANCHATGCGAYIRPGLVLCRRHWILTPAAIQDTLNYHGRVSPQSEKYLTALRDAVIAVAEREGVTPAVKSYDEQLRLLKRRESYRL